MKKLLFLSILIALIVGLFIFSLKPETKQEVTHTPSSNANEVTEKKASFAIFTNGTFRIFTAAMYHNRSGDVFIEASNPNIVNVKKKGLTWGNFFKTLPMELTNECLITGTKQTFCTNDSQTLKFYINGKLDINALEKKIKEGDKLLVSYGDESDSEIEKQLEQIPNP